MTEYVLYIGGSHEIEGKVLSRDGDVLTVELSDGSVITRHEKNFVTMAMQRELVSGFSDIMKSSEVEVEAKAPRKRGRPRKPIAG